MVEYFIKKGSNKRTSGCFFNLAFDHKGTDNCGNSTHNAEYPEDKWKQ